MDGTYGLTTRDNADIIKDICKFVDFYENSAITIKVSTVPKSVLIDHNFTNHALLHNDYAFYPLIPKRLSWAFFGVEMFQRAYSDYLYKMKECKTFTKDFVHRYLDRISAVTEIGYVFEKEDCLPTFLIPLLYMNDIMCSIFEIPLSSMGYKPDRNSILNQAFDQLSGTDWMTINYVTLDEPLYENLRELLKYRSRLIRRAFESSIKGDETIEFPVICRKIQALVSSEESFNEFFQEADPENFQKYYDIVTYGNFETDEKSLLDMLMSYEEYRVTQAMEELIRINDKWINGR